VSVVEPVVTPPSTGAPPPDPVEPDPDPLDPDDPPLLDPPDPELDDPPLLDPLPDLLPEPELVLSPSTDAIFPPHAIAKKIAANENAFVDFKTNLFLGRTPNRSKNSDFRSAPSEVRQRVESSTGGLVVCASVNACGLERARRSRCRPAD
jgi:hypothetical protein